LSQQCKQDEVIVQPHNYVLHDMPLYGLLDKQCIIMTIISFHL